MPLLDRLFDVLSPPTCAACDTSLERAAIFCAPCATSFLDAEDVRLDGLPIIAAGRYGGALALAIQRFKFNERPDLARQLGELLRRAALERRLTADVVIPVPLHHTRAIERGYNQSGLLARRVARTLDARFDAGSLSRIRAGRPQLELGREERAQNVREAFAVAGRRHGLAGRRVILVDDVVTTGATVASCAAALAQAGAVCGAVLCLARAE